MKSPEQILPPKNPREKFWAEMPKPAKGWKGFCCGYGSPGLDPKCLPLWLEAWDSDLLTVKVLMGIQRISTHSAALL